MSRHAKEKQDAPQANESFPPYPTSEEQGLASHSPESSETLEPDQPQPETETEEQTSEQFVEEQKELLPVPKKEKKTARKGNFGQVFQALLSGKHIQRKKRSERGIEIFLTDEDQLVYTSSSKEGEYPYTFTTSDLLAEDWQTA